ncbi:MAG: hypothetical protein DI536_15595 [Archangium gephyra]|uniref:Lipoprotein n=1 Tax=Archangium gephyra TaxID=48 RepID=A0A2W5TM73_9BACT|nr:MAG: hypothetical protein DI536_15595 [Archangium gephyra]
MSRLFLVSALGFIVTGCAGITVKKDQVAATRRVAIVGYQGILQMEDNDASSKNSITGAIGASKAMADMSSGKMGARRGEQAKNGYGELAKRLNGTFGWEIIDQSALGTVPAYQEKVAKSGGLMRTGSQTVEGLLTQYEVNTFKPEQLAAIAQGINADALATVELKYTVGKRGGVSIGGMGSTTKYPVATAHFKVVNKAGEVIWEDWVARGEVASKGLRNTMGADIVAEETEILIEAANSAFDAIIARYQGAEDANAKDKGTVKPSDTAPASTPAAAPATDEKKEEAPPAS